MVQGSAGERRVNGTPEKALSGIRALVAEVVKDMAANGETVPTPTVSPMRQTGRPVARRALAPASIFRVSPSPATGAAAPINDARDKTNPHVSVASPNFPSISRSCF